jgi:hypothetical protein
MSALFRRHAEENHTFVIKNRYTPVRVEQNI